MTSIARMCNTHLWAIADSVPENAIVVEWGAGASSKFLLDHTKLAELHSVEHDPGWRGKVAEECGDDPRFHMAYFNVGKEIEEESVKWMADYSLLHGIPLDRADVIIVDGMSRATCVATAALKAKQEALLFLHDTDSNLYRWPVEFLDMHPDWSKVEDIYTLPEDAFVSKMTVWRRTA